MSPLTVACVLRSGGIYSEEWVYALKRGLSRYMPGRYRDPLSPPEPGTWTLRCLTDSKALGHMAIPLRHGWHGWWSKIELFRPGLFGTRVLYLDLDTLVVGDLTEVAALDVPFAMLSDFYRPEVAESGVMAWRPSPQTEAIYERFCEGPPRLIARYRGDGRFIREHVAHERLQDLVPGQIVSLKVHAKGGPPDGAALVCGHGTPRLNTRAAGWAHREWMSLSREAA